ncbi:MAG: hypothetical protein JNK05_32960 [Myxococcales bacterium]|nr:hypothetical protein [Myxococcales bacterium]
MALRVRAARGLPFAVALAAASCTIDVSLVKDRADAAAESDVSSRDIASPVDAPDVVEAPPDVIGIDAVTADAQEDALVDAIDDADAANADGAITDASVGVWQRVTSPTGSDLRAVWGFGPRDVWIVGDRSTILRWTGTTWSPVSTPAANTSFRSVWGSAPDDVWAVGYDTGGWLVIVHFDGRTWIRVPAPAVRYLPRSVFGMSRTDAWIVGGRVEFSDDIVFRWDGVRWNTIRTGGNRTRYLDIGGTSPTDLWIVALDDTMLRWNGTTFVAPAATLPVAVVTFELGLWAMGPEEFWVTGDAGTMHRFERGTWTSVNTGTRNLLRTVWGIDRSCVWAVGTRGTIARSNGVSWAAIEDITPRTLFGVWAASADDAWAVGEGGTILHSVP